MTAEQAMLEERLDIATVWLRILKYHTPKEKKHLLMDLHSLGGMQPDTLADLFEVMKLREA